MARKLKTIAEEINKIQRLSAHIRKSFSNTDRKCGRQRIPGKGRDGFLLTVQKDGETIFSHDSSHPYRKNSEVEKWLSLQKK